MHKAVSHREPLINTCRAFSLLSAEESALARQVSHRGELRLLYDDSGFEKQVLPKIFK